MRLDKTFTLLLFLSGFWLSLQARLPFEPEKFAGEGLHTLDLQRDAEMQSPPPYWDDPYYYDDFIYSRRLRRFHPTAARSVVYSYYDPFFVNDVYYVVGTPYWNRWNNWYNPWAFQPGNSVVVQRSWFFGLFTTTRVYSTGWNPWGFAANPVWNAGWGWGGPVVHAGWGLNRGWGCNAGWGGGWGRTW